MSKYIIPVCEDNNPYIISTSARSMEEAENRIMTKLVSEWDLDVPADWDDFCDIAYQTGFGIGEIQDIEEF